MKCVIPGVVAAVGLVAAASLSFASPGVTSPAVTSTDAYWRVPGASAEQLEQAGFDVARSTPGAVEVIGTDAVAADLRARGLAPQRLGEVYAPVVSVRAAAPGTYYGGYHTAAAHRQHLDDVAAKYPQLTKVVTLGPSYLKTVGKGGHDLRAICITKKVAGDCELQPNSVKPRAVVMAQIHAREVATGELAWRWIDELTSAYGKDPVITQLVDTRELWVLPVTNPDGLDKVAEGVHRPTSQRKNMRPLEPDCDYGDYKQNGVDLNRNSSFRWKPEANIRPCQLTWPGTGPVSEPETQALEKWFQQLFPDLRDDTDTDPAKPGVRGTMLTLHSYGDYVIYPFGFSLTPPPDAGLVKLAKDLAAINKYTVGGAKETVGYATNGSTDDFTYGTLGVPSFTIELGNSGAAEACGGFFPVYSCSDEFWKKNRGVLIHLAKVADQPFASR